MQSREQDNLESRGEQSRRIEWIDIAKGIGILLVMLGHCYLDRKFTIWFYSFHMALFFFLSGYTFKAKTAFPYFLINANKLVHVKICPMDFRKNKKELSI